MRLMYRGVVRGREYPNAATGPSPLERTDPGRDGGGWAEEVAVFPSTVRRWLYR
jgi:hypothetical protein